MSRAQQLWHAALPVAQQCLAHPFVDGLATGHLPKAAFAFYVGQDAFFLDAYARAYALAFAKAPDRWAAQACKALLDGVFEELRLHESYAAQWGIGLQPPPAPATQSYTDFLLRVAWSEPLGRLAAAMAPCMRLYAFLGQSLAPKAHLQTPYRAWIETYSSPAFADLAARLEAIVDRYDDGSQALAENYATAMRLELAFFEQAGRAEG